MKMHVWRKYGIVDTFGSKKYVGVGDKITCSFLKKNRASITNFL